MMQAVETIERVEHSCPCFEFSNDYGGKKRGTCSLQKFRQHDGYALSSCQHEGDAMSCLSGGKPDIRIKLQVEIEKRVKKITSEKEYFENLLRQL